MRRLYVALLATVAIVFGVLAAPAGAAHRDFLNMSLEFFDPKTDNITSDIAFWGDTAFVGNYDGLRTYDISDPANPSRLADFRCFGPQNDPSVWDTDGNGQADLLVLSVDLTLDAPACGSPQSRHPDGTRHDENPTGWEGIRLFDISNPMNPVFLSAIYLDCGSHTNTMYPDLARNRLVVLNSSYPLRPGPTCGISHDGTDMTKNLANPYDADPGSPADPLHGVIQTVTIPLADGPDAGTTPDAAGSAAAAFEGPQLPINYPGDPDNLFDPAEHQLPGFGKLRACHDITVFVPLKLVASACAEQSQLWRLDDATGLPNTSNPVWVFDQPNIDFHHSATFTWDGKVVNFIDESFGRGCPTVTQGVGQTGRMFFVDTDTGARLSHFMIRRSHQKEEPDYCSAHLGNVVPSTNRYLLVNAWYTGGVDVIDFSNPRAPKEVAFYDVEGDEWSGYWYEQDGTDATGPLNVFGTHGVEHVAAGGGEELEARGFESFLASVAADRETFDHLNPQVQEEVIGASPSKKGSARKEVHAKKAKASSAGKASRRGGGRASRKRVLRHLSP
jgi:hypothetical protein